MEYASLNFNNSPVLIGGVGGSGTRVIAEILMEMGFFLGSNLNKAHDYLGYGLATKLRELRLKEIRGETNNEDIIKYIENRLSVIEKDIVDGMKDPGSYKGWGWKVPGNYYLLKYANKHFSNMKYVHVIRHGLDMAFSTNQNQLNNWGFYFNIKSDNLSHPVASLQYWLAANEFAIDLGSKLLEERFHLIRFDDLIIEPLKTIKKLSKFLGAEIVNTQKLTEKVHKPKSFERYKEYDTSIFSKEDINKVINLGFNVVY